MNQPDLVNKLAGLQAEQKEIENAANSDLPMCRVDLEIREAKAVLAALTQTYDEMAAPYTASIEDIGRQIEEIKAQIVSVWLDTDRSQKAFEYGDNVLKFRTATSLNIENETALLYNLIDHAGIKDVATKYISGFNKTAVKKYMDVHELPTVIAELISKTTVKLEMV